MRNVEMGKWGNGKEGTLHFTQRTDVLLLQSSINVNVHPCTHCEVIFA